MSQTRTGTPEQRLEVMEREMRRVRRLGSFVIVALGVLLGVAAAIIAVAERGRLLDRSHDLVESKRFLLRDESGRIRGVWEATDSGAAQIILSDAAGRERLRLRVLEDGSAGLAMVDSMQRSRAVLATLPDETTALALADGAGRTRAVLGLKLGGTPSLALADPDGTVRTGLGIEGATAGGRVRSEPVEEREPRQREAPSDTITTSDSGR